MGESSGIPFSSLPRISDKTVKALSEMGLTNMTKIQAQCIPPLLLARNVVGCSKTGSGKTLAFVIPVVELLYKSRAKLRNGTIAIIISPTRELATQTFDVLKQVMKYHSQRIGLVIGGADRKREAERLYWGVNILVATPGRLLDHLENTEGFHHGNMLFLVIDEVDRLLDVGFEVEMKRILQLLPTRWFTAVFSATLTRKAEDLIRVAMPQQDQETLYFGVEEQSVATVESIQQAFVLCPSEKRFVLLYTFLKRNEQKKVMVFFSSCLSVKYHNDLFNYVSLTVTCFHGQLTQQQRTRVLRQFCKAKTGIMLCSDIASRGLDIPQVDWIVQYDPPNDVKTYIHRVGRTARGECQTGNALLILRPEEERFRPYLTHARIPLIQHEPLWENGFHVEEAHIDLVTNNAHFRQLGKQAFKAYIRAYRSHHMKNCFSIESLDMTAVAKSFGLKTPPFVK